MILENLPNIMEAQQVKIHISTTIVNYDAAINVRKTYIACTWEMNGKRHVLGK